MAASKRDITGSKEADIKQGPVSKSWQQSLNTLPAHFNAVFQKANIHRDELKTSLAAELKKVYGSELEKDSILISSTRKKKLKIARDLLKTLDSKVTNINDVIFLKKVCEQFSKANLENLSPKGGRIGPILSSLVLDLAKLEKDVSDDISNVVPNQLFDTVIALNAALTYIDYYAPRSLTSIGLTKGDKEALKVIEPQYRLIENEKEEYPFLTTSITQSYDDADKAANAIKQELIACEKFSVLVQTYKSEAFPSEEKLSDDISRRFLVERYLSECDRKARQVFVKKGSMIHETDEEQWYRDQLKSENEASRFEFAGNIALFKNTFRQLATDFPVDEKKVTEMLVNHFNTYTTWNKADNYEKKSLQDVIQVFASEIGTLNKNHAELKKAETVDTSGLSKEEKERYTYLAACQKEASQLASVLHFESVIKKDDTPSPRPSIT